LANAVASARLGLCRDGAADDVAVLSLRLSLELAPEPGPEPSGTAPARYSLPCPRDDADNALPEGDSVNPIVAAFSSRSAS